MLLFGLRIKNHMGARLRRPVPPCKWFCYKSFTPPSPNRQRILFLHALSCVGIFWVDGSSFCRFYSYYHIVMGICK